jgi:hypothetical protein
MQKLEAPDLSVVVRSRFAMVHPRSLFPVTFQRAYQLPIFTAFAVSTRKGVGFFAAIARKLPAKNVAPEQMLNNGKFSTAQIRCWRGFTGKCNF